MNTYIDALVTFTASWWIDVSLSCHCFIFIT